MFAVIFIKVHVPVLSVRHVTGWHVTFGGECQGSLVSTIVKQPHKSITCSHSAPVSSFKWKFLQGPVVSQSGSCVAKLAGQTLS